MKRVPSLILRFLAVVVVAVGAIVIDQYGQRHPHDTAPDPPISNTDLSTPGSDGFGTLK